MERFVLAIDQGTTSSRAIVFGTSADARAVAQHPIPSTFRNPGWVEQDATEIWETTLRVTRQAVAESGFEPERIAAIGIANQRETTVVWDRATSRPVAPAIVWQSRQSVPLVDAIAERGMAARYQDVTGLVPDAYFSATKVAWLLESDRDLRSRAEAGDLLMGTVDSWLMWQLSAGRRHVTDWSNASRTMLFDIRTGQWSDELLRDLAVPAAMLPTVVDSSGHVLDCDDAVVGRSLPVTGVAGDQQAALFGQACFGVGEAKNTYGTGSFLLMNTGKDAVASTSNLLTTIAWGMGGTTTYALEGAIFVTGSAVQWLRDGLGIIERSADVEPLAASVPDSGGVVFVPALVGLGAPHWDQDARGTIVGLTRGSTKAHIARATLEAIALQTADVIDAMAADSGVALMELRVDGGAVRNDLLMQIQADVLGVPVVRPAITETTALGAAYLAGLAAGVWSSRDEVAAQWRVDRRFEPAMIEEDRRRLRERWRAAVERAKGWEQ